MLKLQRPIVFIDIESTGLDVQNDRIVQIAFTKLLPDFSRESKSKLINPEMKIPEASTAIHGITDEMVKDVPTFKQIAKGMVEFIWCCDLGGFNSNIFDFPLLNAEFERAGYSFDFSNVHLVDVGNIFKIQNPRTLSAAYKQYTGNELENAHDAQVDIDATVDVFIKQIEEHDDIPKTIEEIALYSNYSRKMADLSGKFYYDEQGEVRLNFGKYRNELAKDQISFIDWMANKASFPADTNRIAHDILNDYYSQD